MSESTPTHSTSEAAIWERMFKTEHAELTEDAARYFLELGFADSDLERMRFLIQRCQADELTEDEQLELNAYRQVGFQIDLLKSKARRTLDVDPEAPGLR